MNRLNLIPYMKDITLHNYLHLHGCNASLIPDDNTPSHLALAALILQSNINEECMIESYIEIDRLMPEVWTSLIKRMDEHVRRGFMTRGRLVYMLGYTSSSVIEAIADSDGLTRHLFDMIDMRDVIARMFDTDTDPDVLIRMYELYPQEFRDVVTNQEEIDILVAIRLVRDCKIECRVSAYTDCDYSSIAVDQVIALVDNYERPFIYNKCVHRLPLHVRPYLHEYCIQMHNCVHNS